MVLTNDSAYRYDAGRDTGQALSSGCLTGVCIVDIRASQVSSVTCEDKKVVLRSTLHHFIPISRPSAKSLVAEGQKNVFQFLSIESFCVKHLLNHGLTFLLPYSG